MRALLTVLVLGTAIAAADAAPPSKTACAAACQAEIADCAAATGHLARCRRQLVRRCRRRGLQSCAGGTMTSTTTLPGGVTTTTTAGSLQVAGPWTFDGPLLTDDCGGGAARLTAPLYVTQTGADIQVTFVNEMEAGTGEVGAAGWSGRSHVCPTTTVCFEHEIVAAPGNPADAAFAARQIYGDGTSCQRQWRGKVRRGP